MNAVPRAVWVMLGALAVVAIGLGSLMFLDVPAPPQPYEKAVSVPAQGGSQPSGM